MPFNLCVKVLITVGRYCFCANMHNCLLIKFKIIILCYYAASAVFRLSMRSDYASVVSSVTSNL